MCSAKQLEAYGFGCLVIGKVGTAAQWAAFLFIHERVRRMDNKYVVVLLPDTFIQLFLILLIITGIASHIYSWRVDKRKVKAVRQLEDQMKKFRIMCQTINGDKEGSI